MYCKTKIHRRTAQLWRGRTVALFGGSFNPAHDGHYQLSKHALLRLKCDFVWWLVSPCNPLKKSKDMASYDRRLESARQKTSSNPRMIASDIEQEFGTYYSFLTIKKLKRHFPKTNFIWIMGQDNVPIIHKWYGWRALFNLLPVAIFHRKQKNKSVSYQSLNRIKKHQISEHKAGKLSNISRQSAHPRWVMMHTKRHEQSSTEIRKAGLWRA